MGNKILVFTGGYEFQTEKFFENFHDLTVQWWQRRKKEWAVGIQIHATLAQHHYLKQYKFKLLRNTELPYTNEPFTQATHASEWHNSHSFTLSGLHNEP